MNRWYTSTAGYFTLHKLNEVILISSYIEIDIKHIRLFLVLMIMWIVG